MTTEALPKAPYNPTNPGFGFTDVPAEEFDYPFPALTLEQRMRFELYGYTVVEDLFTEEELGAIEAAAGGLKGELLEAAGDATFEPLPPPEKYHPFRDGATNDPRSNEDTRGGRQAADDVFGTPYGRPEDMEVGMLPNFNEVLYVATTSEHAIISIEMLGNRRAMVRQFASRETPTNLGLPATTGVLNSPDNLAQDALGNLYVIEDSPNRGDVGGDVWFARDTDDDGVAESLDHFMSLQVAGSESTGMIFHPRQPATFAMAVQHPASTDLDNVPEGFGDAV